MIDKSIIDSFLEGKRGKVENELINESDKIKVHSNGLFPTILLDQLRPNEPELIKEYRKKIWKPNTKSAFSKVFQLLYKIQKSEDWRIEYPESVGAIPENEQLKEYCENNYPYFDSITNYYFTVLLKKLLVEPNGVLIIFPENLVDKPQNEFFKPFAYQFDTKQVIEFKENEFCAVRVNYEQTSEFYLIDKEDFVKVIVNHKDNSNTQISFRHNFGEMPAFRLGGFVKEFNQKTFIYESFINGAIAKWDEAVRLYSDHQANLVMHLHPEKWQFQTSECNTCKGTGMLKDVNGLLVPCRTLRADCNGTGFHTSPFGIHSVPKANLGDVQIPTPPAGYIEKPIELIQALKDEIKEQINDGFSALGLEFLNEVPANNSGIAKEYDREEVNGYLNTVARHIVENNLKWIFWFTSKWRYSNILSNEQLQSNLPTINIPEKFDSLTTRILSERLKNAKENNYNYATRISFEIDYAKKEFGEGSEQWKYIKAISELDTLPDIDNESKMTILANRGCTLLDYVISCNIHNFVTRAKFENTNFYELDYSAKRGVIEVYANEVINNSSPISI